jgi:type I restriction enzyme M protein
LWLRDESLEGSDNLPDPDVLVQEIIDPSTPLTRDDPEPGSTVEDLQSALEQFREIAADV